MTTSPSAPNERHKCADHLPGEVAVRGLANSHSGLPTDQVVGDWLGALRDELRWREDHAGSVCDELESHIAERTRDLVLCGYGEEAAVRVALDELGEPRAMATCYRRAQVEPARRYVMNASLFLLSGAALGLSIMAVASRPDLPVGQPPVESASEAIHLRPVLDGANLKIIVSEPNGLVDAVTASRLQYIPDALTPSTERALQRMLSAQYLSNIPKTDEGGHMGIQTSRFERPSSLPQVIGEKMVTLVCSDKPLAEVLTMLAGLCERQVAVQWDAINATGADRDTPVSLELRERSVDEVIRAINEFVARDSGRRIDARAEGNTLEFGSVEYFDQREMSLVSYDLSSLNNVDSDSLKDLLQTFVEPDGWKDQGGSMAWLKFAGPKMFVQAPKRYHTHIEWFLNELQAN